jgi:hypothetical protein
MRRLYRFLLPPSDIARVAGGVLAGALLLSVASAQAATIPFLPHQASYDLSLLKSRNGAAAVDSARGRILYNFTGSACGGYTSEFRQVSELNGSEGKSTLSDLRSTSWEDADGKTYRFKIDTRMNEGNASDVDGIAERTGDHVTVKLKQPVAKTFTLDGSTVFPTQQVRRIIAAAREGKSTLSDLRSTSWEDADGKTYRFKIDTRMNEGNASDVDGIAERTGDHVTVKLKQPVAKTFTLDGSTVFPTQQVRRIIAAAREGKSLLELTVYDGSDNGEKVYNTLTVIGKPIPGDKVTTPDPSTSNDTMKTLTRWPVTVSYYDRDAKSNAGEQTPTYAMSFELYENGVSRALKLDYNDFVIGGTLDKFEVKSSKPCKTGEK